MDDAIRAYVALAVRTVPDIAQIWSLPSPGPTIDLAIVSDRFSGSEYPQTVDRLYSILWQMPRPVPPVRLHVFDLEEFAGLRGDEVRRRGKSLYNREA